MGWLRRHGLFLLAGLLLAVGAGRDGVEDWVTRTRLPSLIVPTGTEIVARDGTLLRAFVVVDGRWRLQPGPVDPGFVEMLLAYEDRRFWHHSGVDALAFLRATGQALREGRVVSGGSTLTMQVARLLEEGPTGQWDGKLRQMRVALALERRLDKQQILDLYLRLAPYGGNLEGIRAASLSWFGKEPRRLTPAESALLVALPQSPAVRQPDRNPDAARRAVDRVLARAVAANVIEEDQARAARLATLPATRRPFPALAPHLTARLHWENPDAARIATTIDADLQRAAEALARRAVAGQTAEVTVAMLLADHRTGQILAQVDGAEWTSTARAGFVQMSDALRSPGSTLKPFVYGLAFDDGMAHPDTLIEDRPVAYGRYAPQNFDRQFRGTVTVRDALLASLNIPVVRLTDAVGPARLIDALDRAGAPLTVPGGQPGLAVALGGAGVSLAALVQAYGGLAAGGKAVALSPLPGMGGRTDRRFLGDVAAWQVGHILSQVPPPAGAARGRIAYKTGTSYGHRDALAVGFDGAHVGGVWMGRADGTPVPGAFGGDLAAPVLFELFDRAQAGGSPLPPPPDATLILPTARLPAPLRRFRPPGEALSERAPDAPQMVFPPDGAQIEAPFGRLVVKVRNGAPPFTWLADGRPVAIARSETALELDLPRAGLTRLSVIDVKGRADSVNIVIKP
ncbi:penicillin-binding protein 1C [Paracoccus tegillarcae]|uniref:peptidoglycan glycosyltransferase n=1 Tax=Paracoccus tegillarcae TaxID=1529068 RepID=A0A2K9EIV7_9RHOB|nr:penicillin-binding protein 1C [Paracoccus tegillarcae]AUH33297.1 penicillin-binding protein 1C [Paracoccus tegillarcae]